MEKSYNCCHSATLYFALLVLFSFILPLQADAQTAPTEGMQHNSPSVHAFTNATIVISPGHTIENATLVIRDGLIESVGTGAAIPPDARIWEMDDKTIYPGFIDPYSGIGMQSPPEEIEKGDISWNPQLRSQLKATSEYDPENDGRKSLREQGFTAAMSIPPVGIFRGETALFSLGNGPVSDRVILSDIAQAVSMKRSNELGFHYPTSPMGVIAFIRQTLHDADWHERAHAAYRSHPEGLKRPESNSALAALHDAYSGSQPLLFETRDEHQILRSLRFAEEFPITPWIKGNGYEYRIADVLSESNTPLILPLDFPDKPDVDSPEEALNRNLQEMRHWYLAPENPKRLAEAGITFSFTTDGLEDPAQLLPNLRKSVKAGLDPEIALAGLTVNPATLLGVADTHGTLETGKTANFVVTDGDLFDSDTWFFDVWIDGDHFRIHQLPTTDPRGDWQLVSADRTVRGSLSLKGEPDALVGTIRVEGVQIDLTSAELKDQARRLRVAFPGEHLDLEGPVRLTATLSGDELYGWAEVHGMERMEWTGKRTAAYEPGENDAETEETESPARDLVLSKIRPDMEYGRPSIPDQPEHVVVRNATVWTMGPDSILENADLLVSGGEIVETGQNLEAPAGAIEIEASGKHVTPGLIDAHLHSGTDGVNEIGNAIVPEVQLGDVLNINNIWMYRQLAGGLTTAHVMHGSANPIGGQNQHLKMRWGATPEELKFEGAPRTVKFALGENVVRVGTERYPETRMGTQQIMADRFRQARDYRARWQEWEETGEGLPPRKDLRLEALADILDGDILIQSHSYRADEILMLTRLAEEFGISVKAFHHGVEAYKVASELAEAGVGAVVWTDWSSFKIEAYDATNYNARLLHEAGVLTSLHSDNSQIASRMNWEAAKMVRTGMEPEDALALVTINTAKLLGVDEHVGSLEPGKDADFVIWSGNPLSTATRAEQTWIDGRKYYDMEEDAELRQAVEDERSQLIRLIMED